jgi:hypothetical protein
LFTEQKATEKELGMVKSLFDDNMNNNVKNDKVSKKELHLKVDNLYDFLAGDLLT